MEDFTNFGDVEKLEIVLRDIIDPTILTVDKYRNVKTFALELQYNEILLALLVKYAKTLDQDTYYNALDKIEELKGKVEADIDKKRNDEARKKDDPNWYRMQMVYERLALEEKLAINSKYWLFEDLSLE